MLVSSKPGGQLGLLPSPTQVRGTSHRAGQGAQRLGDHQKITEQKLGQEKNTDSRVSGLSQVVNRGTCCRREQISEQSGVGFF